MYLQHHTAQICLCQAFARRSLSKIHELSMLERMSKSPESKKTETILRIATIKVSYI